MKKNILVVESPHPPRGAKSDQDLVLAYCEAASANAYVYLVRPGTETMVDTDGGVRLLANEVDALPKFGSLAAVVAVGDISLLTALQLTYPDTRVVLWRDGQAEPGMATFRHCSSIETIDHRTPPETLLTEPAPERQPRPGGRQQYAAAAS